MKYFYAYPLHLALPSAKYHPLAEPIHLRADPPQSLLAHLRLSLLDGVQEQ